MDRGALLIMILVVSMAAMAPSAACAEEPGDVNSKSKTYFSRGVILYNGGDYGGALENFLQAYDLNPHYQLKYNIGVCYMKLERWADAGNEFETYLLLEKDPDTEQYKKIEGALEKIAGHTAVLNVLTEVDGTDIRVDGLSYGPSPLGRGIYVMPGDHVVEGIAPDGRKAEALVSVEAMENLEVSLGFEAWPTVEIGPGPDTKAIPKIPEPEKPEAVKGKKRVHRGWAFGALGMTAAVLAAAVGTGAAAWQKRNEVKSMDEDCLGSGCNLDASAHLAYTARRQDALDEAKSLALSSTVLFAAAGLFASVTLTLFLLSVEKRGNRKTAMTGLSLAPGGLGIDLEVTFQP